MRLTGQGRAAVASVLVEGAGAAHIVGALFHPAAGRPLVERPFRRIVFGRWQSPDAGEEVVVCRLSADRVEIHSHGGRAAVEALVAALVAHGCREISWPQWIRQSAADPIAADAQIALAAAPTARTAMILWDQLAGALRRTIEEVAGLVTAGDNTAAVERIDALLHFAALGRHLVEPWKVVLAGRPNVGKSSLINALVGFQRAIVHSAPGTTRDVVTAATAVDGWPIELADTAGLRTGGEPLEAAGMNLARDMLRSADLVVLVFDASQSWSADDEALWRQQSAALRVFNKSDLPAADKLGKPPGISTSALGGDGLDELQRAIAERLVPRLAPPGQPMPFLPWHVEVLTAARSALGAGQASSARSLLARFDAC